MIKARTKTDIGVTWKPCIIDGLYIVVVSVLTVSVIRSHNKVCLLSLKLRISLYDSFPCLQHERLNIFPGTLFIERTVIIKEMCHLFKFRALLGWTSINSTFPGSSLVTDETNLPEKQDKKGRISEGQLLEELPT